ncbi:oligosaccharide flippase family protein [Viscerimonas tarda]
MALKPRPDTDMDMEENNVKKKLFAFNSFTGILQFALTAVLIAVCIPVFISNLGEELYGIFCVVSVVGNLAIFANLSLDASLIKFLAEQGKCKESDYDIVTMLILMVLILVPVSVLLYILRNVILIYLEVPVQYMEESSLLLTYLILANSLLLTGKIFSSILDSIQKIYLTNFAMFIYSVIYWAGIIGVTLNGGGLKEIGLIILFAAFVWFILVTVLAFKNWGKIETTGIGKQFKQLAKKQLTYSSKIYSGALLGFLYEPLTKVLITKFFGFTYVGIYENALKIKTQLFGVFIKILQPLYPTIANLSDLKQIKEIITKLGIYVSYIAIPVATLICFCSKDIITLWLSGKLSADNISLTATSVIFIAGACVLFSIPIMPIYFFLRAKNHPDKEIYIQLVNVVVNLAVVFAFYEKLGFYSILLGNTLSYFFSFLLCLYYQKKYLNIIPFGQKQELLKYLFSFVVIAGVTTLFSPILQDISFLNVFMKIAFVCAVTFPVFFFLKIFNKKDFRFN